MARKDSRKRDKLDEQVVHITRTATVIKGGRRFAFRAVVVVGDNRGRVGVGVGKARGVPDAIHKGADQAKKDMRKISLIGTTIPHEVIAKSGGAKVLLKPASPGTGIIAGGGVRAVVEAVGIRDILTKSLGNSNVLNVAKATVKGLSQLKDIEEEARLRGKTVAELMPFWARERAGG